LRCGFTAPAERSPRSSCLLKQIPDQGLVHNSKVPLAQTGSLTLPLRHTW
jgi:hypothetical protein